MTSKQHILTLTLCLTSLHKMRQMPSEYNFLPLFLSTAFVPNLELQGNLILELYKIHPEYRWLNNIIKIVQGCVNKIIDRFVTNVSDAPIFDAPCLWLIHHPDLPHTILQPFLCNLFTHCPLGRPLSFMPYSFQLHLNLFVLGTH
jgi:hypothetical protein